MLAYAAEHLPRGLSLDRFSGEIRGKPVASGRFIVTVSAATAAGTAQPLEICFHIEPGAMAPTLNSGYYFSGSVGDEISFQLRATDLPVHDIFNPLPDGYAYHVEGLPEGLQLDARTGYITGIIVQEGRVEFDAWASNEAGAGEKRRAVVNGITVSEGNPQILGPSHLVMQLGERRSFQVNAINAITYTISTGYGLKVLSGDHSTGHYEVQAEIGGTLYQYIRAYGKRRSSFGRRRSYYEYSDSRPSDYLRMRVEVLPSANAPRMTMPARITVKSGEPINTALSSEPTADSYQLDWSASRMIPGVGLNSNGTLSGTPGDPGRYVLNVRGQSSTHGWGVYDQLIVNVEPADDAPVINSIAPSVQPEFAATAFGISAYSTPSAPSLVEITAGDAVDLAVGASSAVTGYEVDGLPAGLLVNPATGRISGITDVPGDYAVSIRPMNGESIGAAFELCLRVLATPGAPVLTVPEIWTAQAGEFFAESVLASNLPDGFLATGLPVGLAMNTTNGVVSGIPSVPGTYALELIAANEIGESFPVAVELQVAAAAGTPEISGSKHHVLELGSNGVYSVSTSPEATYFSADGLPLGLSIDSDTGIISGAPQQTGVYAAILKAWNEVGEGNAVEWTFAVGGADGTIAAEYAGSVIFDAAVSNAFTVSAPGATGFNINELPPGIMFDELTGDIIINGAAPGAYRLEISANNATGRGDPLVLWIRVGDEYVLWAASRFGDSTVLDESMRASVWGRSADFDQDGNANADERITGTDVTDPASRFAAEFSQVAGGYVIEWQSVSNRIYEVRWTSGLDQPFQALESDIPYPQNGYTDAVHTVEDQGFYSIDVKLQN